MRSHPVSIITAGLLSSLPSLLLASSFLGCAVPSVNTRLLSPTPGIPLVARKIQRPLTIVLDPELVQDTHVIHGSGKQIAVDEAREFVRRDLRQVMQAFFKTVEVVGPDADLDPTGHVARVRVDRLDVTGTFSTTPSVGMGGQVYGRITWSFAILPPDAQDYLFSYAAATSGDLPLVRVGEVSSVIESTYTKAIEAMVQEFVDGGAYQQLLAFDETATEAPHPAPAGETPPSPSDEVGADEVAEDVGAGADQPE